MNNLIEKVNQKLEEYMDIRYPESIFNSMKYTVTLPGKRLRPVMCLEACRIFGGNIEDAMPIACAIEMLHAQSLIHDDLPCMDNDDFRRGKPSNHKVFGEAIAVLAGDGLLTAAFSQIANADLSANVRIHAVQILSACAGELGMVGGQVLDMESEKRQCTAEEVIAIQSRKTGALIRAACMLGVVAADGSDEQLRAAADFAAHLGLAFQIRDDVLDVIGNASELGKAVGVDLNKNTFIQLYGLDECQELIKKHTDEALNALSVLEDTAYMYQLASELTNRTV